MQPVSDSEAIIYKPCWGGFYGTPLESRLRDLGVNTTVFTSGVSKPP